MTYKNSNLIKNYSPNLILTKQNQTDLPATADTFLIYLPLISTLNALSTH
ncbi:hypothetical protein Hanom_Chr05g00408831 [Helianthus anomalus]